MNQPILTPPVDPNKLSIPEIVGIAIGAIVLLSLIIGFAVVGINNAAGGSLTSKAGSAIPTSAGPTSTATAAPTSPPTTTGPGGSTPAPTTTAPATTAIPPIYLHLKITAAGGNFGNRATTNATCAADATLAGLTCTANYALLTYASDRIADMATTYSFDGSRPLRLGVNNALVKSTFNAAVAAGTASIDGSLQSLGLVSTPPVSYTTYATGYNYGAPDTCVNWTSNSSIEYGDGGDKGTASFDWISNNGAGCDQIKNFLCICV